MKRLLLIATCLFSYSAYAEAKGAYSPPPMNAEEQKLVAASGDSIRQQVMPCWNLPADEMVQNTAVTISIEVNRDGRIAKMTLPKQDAPKYHTDTGYRAAANAAMAALMKCQPIKGLPADKYDGWKDMNITFDPRQAKSMLPPTDAQLQEAPADAAAISGTGLTGAQPKSDGVIPADQIH